MKIGHTKIHVFRKGGIRYVRSYRWDGKVWLFVMERRANFGE